MKHLHVPLIDLTADMIASINQVHEKSCDIIISLTQSDIDPESIKCFKMIVDRKIGVIEHA